MAKLAIKGHETRSKEVIEILEMLGGNNKYRINITECNLLYTIREGDDVIIGTYPNSSISQIYTIEEFLEKFPYKVGDKVLYHDSKAYIKSMKWGSREIIYTVEWEKGLWETTVFYLQPYKEETMNKTVFDVNAQCCDIMNHLIKKEAVEENLTIQDIRDNNAEWLLNKLQEMSSKKVLQVISDLYDNLHKPQYPKTYGECHELMVQWKEYDCNPNSELILCDAPIHDFCKLIVARNIYWKIAGEEMGLGKPWKPDWESESTPKYVISQAKNKIRFLKAHEYNHILSFPTTEMREAFYENFKELIEACKELL